MVSVSVIITVKNEVSSIATLLDSLLAQERKPQEVVVVDGGSTDGTLEVLRSYQGRIPLVVLLREGSNISQGRNAAIAVARGEVIASTDAGVRLDPGWLKGLLAPFEGQGPVDVVSGFFLPEPRSAFEVALGATTLPVESDIEPRRFLPSSRSVAFRKEAWLKVGGYPEWLDYCEDLIFDFKLREAGYKFVFAPQAVAYFRPRPTLGAFFLQHFRYARGDGKANLWPKRHAIRYSTYFLAVPLLLALGFLHPPLWWGFLVVGMALYLWTPYKRLLSMLPRLGLADRIKALLFIPLIRFAGDLAKMSGYPVGCLWRFRHRFDRKGNFC